MSQKNDIAIIDEIGRWKIILLKDLFQILIHEKSYVSFCEKIRRLEKNGHIKSTFLSREGKVLFLTPRGATLSSFPAMSDKGSLFHDLMCSKVILRLLKFDHFLNGSAAEGLESELLPDGVIRAIRNGEEYVLALELELTRKSKIRVVRKFVRYAKDNTFARVLYLTNKPTIFNGYRKILMGLKKYIGKRVVLGLDKNLFQDNFDFEGCTCWFDGEESDFQTLFGEKR